MKTYIYLVENCYGDPNKVYIGKEKFPKKSKKREYDHRKTYGRNIQLTQIDEVKSWDKKDWKPLECYWIEQFRQWGFDVQNKNEGGNGCDFHTFQTIEKISKSKRGNKFNLGRKYSQISKEKISKAKKGKKYNITKTGNNHGNFGKIRNSEWILKHKKPKGPFNDFWKKNISVGKTGKGVKPINQFDLNGNFIKKWNSAREIFNTLNIKSGDICNVCRNKQKTAGGYRWSYE